MASSLPPVRGAAFTFPISLVSQGDTDIFQTGVTITTADVWVSKDFGAFAAATAAPTELLTTPGGANTGVLSQGLTATEMTADVVTVLYHDASGSQWQDALVTIYTAAQTMDTIDTNVDSVLADTGTDGVLLAGTQGTITFGQVKIAANVTGQGALHITNAHASGYGMYTSGVYGAYNVGTTAGLYNQSTANYGQVNDGGTGYGLYNLGTTAPITGNITGNLSGSVGSVGTGVTLAASQGAVTFGQVKIAANVTGEGALHVTNAHANGYGLYTSGDYGQYNNGVSVGLYNAGEYAQNNYGTEYGLYNAGSVPIVGNITGNLSGSVGSVATGGIAAASFASGAITAAAIAADAITSSELAESAVAEIWAYTTRTLTQGSTTTSDTTASGAITRKRGNSWSISLTLGAITGYTSLWFTLKRSYDDADSASVVQIKLNSPSASDGLLYVNGAAATNSALGSITVSNATTGAVVVALDETVTDDIVPGAYYYDCQALISGSVSTPDAGTFTVTADVTRSVT